MSVAGFNDKIQKMPKRINFRYYDLIIAAFAASLLISNLSATKLIGIGPIITDGGALLFPLVYILGDVLTEVYGYAYARRAIWVGFGIMAIAVFAFTIVRYAPGADVYTDQAAYEAVLGFFPRIVLASLLAYLVGSFINAYILSWLKVKMAGKKLWVRLIGSTFVGEFFDTLVFGLVAFGGILGARDMIIFILVGWLFKTAVEILLLPATYRVVGWLKKAERHDHYDTGDNYSPFHISI